MEEASKSSEGGGGDQSPRTDPGGGGASRTSAIDPSIVLEEHSTERFGPVLVIKSEDGQVLHVQQAHNFTNKGMLGTSAEETKATIAEIERQVNLLPDPVPTEGGGNDEPSGEVRKSGDSTKAERSESGGGGSVSESSSSFQRKPSQGGRSSDLDKERAAPLPKVSQSSQKVRGEESKPANEGTVPVSSGEDSRPTGSATVGEEELSRIEGASKDDVEGDTEEEGDDPSFQSGPIHFSSGKLQVKNTQRFGTMYVLKDHVGRTLGVFTKDSFEKNDDMLSSSSLTGAGAAGAPSAKEVESETAPKETGPASNPAMTTTTTSGAYPEEAGLPRPASPPTQQQPEMATVRSSKSGRFNLISDGAATLGLLQKQPSTRPLAAVPSGTVEDEAAGGIFPKFSDGGVQEELFEFGNFRSMPFYKRTWYSIEKDIYNWYGSFLSLISHGWGFESFLTLVLAVASTTFFCYYRTPEGTPLAARLDFSIIGSALVFPVTFLIGETFRRREGAIQRLASIKAVICQIEIAMLTWRWKGTNTDLGVEWEDRLHQTLHYIVNTMVAILQLPTWNTNRHIYTAQGREFKARVIKRERELTRRLGLLFSELHWYVEDLKDRGLPANEASRINQYHSMLQIDFEALAMVKSYRTPNGEFSLMSQPEVWMY